MQIAIKSNFMKNNIETKSQFISGDWKLLWFLFVFFVFCFVLLFFLFFYNVNIEYWCDLWLWAIKTYGTQLNCIGYKLLHFDFCLHCKPRRRSFDFIDCENITKKMFTNSMFLLANRLRDCFRYIHSNNQEKSIIIGKKRQSMKK